MNVYLFKIALGASYDPVAGSRILAARRKGGQGVMCHEPWCDAQGRRH